MGATILVVNRISTLRRVTVQALNKLGYSNVEQASNTEEAQKKINEIENDMLVILELTASKSTIDEFEFLKTLKKDVPVIMTCQKIDKELVMEAAKFGVKKFVIKSTDVEDFSKKLKEHVGCLMPSKVSE